MGPGHCKSDRDGLGVNGRLIFTTLNHLFLHKIKPGKYTSSFFELVIGRAMRYVGGKTIFSNGAPTCEPCINMVSIALSPVLSKF